MKKHKLKSEFLYKVYFYFLFQTSFCEWLGFLGLNGGIAGAIGNIFVLDYDTELIKITVNYESLGPLAQKLYEKLRGEINNLHEYTFCFNVDKFPVLSFDRKSYAEKTAGDFLSKF